ncbi:MAG: hypothetical protein ACKOXM_04265 [Agromyces sp.]
MTSADRRAARTEVEAARAALIEHLNQLEEAVNVPKRVARSVGIWAGSARRWAAERPVAASAAAAVGTAVLAGIVTAVTRIARR